VDFCTRCDTRLILKTRSRTRLYCPRCEYEKELPEGNFLKNVFRAVKPFDSKVVVVDKDESNLRTLPTIRAYCQKCGGNRAETWTMATGSEGISDIIFYRCVSCGYTWRELG